MERKRPRRPVGITFARTLEIVGRLEGAAAANRSLITASTASAAGLSSATMERLCVSRRWVRVARGVFAVAGHEGGPFQLAAAELLSAGETAYLRLRVAAALHGGLDLPWRGEVHVGVDRGASGRRYRRCIVPPEHIIEVDFLRCTDVLQTLLDLAAVLDDIQWEWALEAALRSRRTSVEQIELALAAPGRKNREAVARVRRVLAGRPPGAKPTGSQLETRFVQLARRFGVPDAERQYEVITAGGFLTYCDFAWPNLQLFVEIDGQGHRDQPVYDSRRQTAITVVTGWACGRFSWDEIVRNPTVSGRRLVALIEERQARFPRA